MKEEEVKIEETVEYAFKFEMYLEDIADADQLGIATAIYDRHRDFCIHAFGYPLQDLMKEQLDYIGNAVDDYTKEWIVEELQKVIDMVKSYGVKDETAD